MSDDDRPIVSKYTQNLSFNSNENTEDDFDKYSNPKPQYTNFSKPTLEVSKSSVLNDYPFLKIQREFNKDSSSKASAITYTINSETKKITIRQNEPRDDRAIIQQPFFTSRSVDDDAEKREPVLAKRKPALAKSFSRRNSKKSDKSDENEEFDQGAQTERIDLRRRSFNREPNLNRKPVRFNETNLFKQPNSDKTKQRPNVLSPVQNSQSLPALGYTVTPRAPVITLPANELNPYLASQYYYGNQLFVPAPVTNLTGAFPTGATTTLPVIVNDNAGRVASPLLILHTDTSNPDYDVEYLVKANNNETFLQPNQAMNGFYFNAESNYYTNMPYALPIPTQIQAQVPVQPANNVYIANKGLVNHPLVSQRPVITELPPTRAYLKPVTNKNLNLYKNTPRS